MSYYVVMEFKILRRIAWDGELDELRTHLDSVCDALDENAEVIEWNLVGDLDQANLELQLVVDASDADAAETLARSAVGEAIRLSGAMHEGLLSLREESEAKINANAWYGLRTPRWQQRRVLLSKL